MKIRPMKSRRAMQGLSLVELMIAMTLGLIVLAALVSVFANTSASRGELERTSRQIESGRFAMELLADDIRHAGFYGEANVKGRLIDGALSADLTSPADTLCRLDGNNPVELATWKRTMPIGVQGFDQGQFLPSCFAGSLKANTDLIAIRRASTCEAGAGDCPALEPLENYVQVSKCGDETATPEFIGFGIYGVSTTFTRKEKNCTTVARLRKYIERIYFVSPDNGRGVNVPTLKRLELKAQTLQEVPLVEGIEELHFEYGIDTDNDGMPDVYTADPNTYNGCQPLRGNTCMDQNWSNVMTVGIHLLARNLEESPNYTDTKTYTLGHDASGAPIVKQANDHYRRHAYNAVIRIVNAGARRDVP